MCSNLQTTAEGQSFPCRNCDDCIAYRRESWVSRAMAEKAISPFTYCLALTYSEDTEENRAGARMFRYSDVQKFLKRLRDHAFQATGLRGLVRYICAGEQGDRNGRCHWHIVLFTSFDILTLGEFRAPWGVVTSRGQIVTSDGQRKKRRNWSFWPHGFTVVQEPDEGGIRYAISYALKDQFGMNKTRGTKREAKSETWATGMFRPSKEPPIGWPWIEAKLQSLAAQSAVLPHTRLSIPDKRGYFSPSGAMRRRLLVGLREINARHFETTGRNCPQWSTLLESCKGSEKDLEILHGKEEEDDIEERVRERARLCDIEQRERRRRAEARKCGSTVACSKCLRGADPFDTGILARHGIEQVQHETGYSTFRFINDDPFGLRLYAAQRDGSLGSAANPLCALGALSAS